MSTARLTFLYPHLFRSLRASELIARTVRLRARNSPPQCLNSRAFATTQRRRGPTVKRHGKAVEPMPFQEEEEVEEKEDFALAENSKIAADEGEVKGKQDTKDGKTEKAPQEPSSSSPLSEETQAAAKLPGDDGSVEEKILEKEGQPPVQEPAANASDTLAPLETVLHMPPPKTAEAENAARPPHLQTPPYVHHFDTYTLVQQVEAGGFTPEQSITAMKAVRGLLALNLDVAKAGLVSKSDVENETYLFRAACSELRTEVMNNRKKSEETMRRERTLLQHEVDILNQKLTQELLSLKDDLKGMFDDRKMIVRMDQRAMESKIQELNYKITVMLNSDAKSEVEGLRWVLTRRSAIGILFMAFMVLTSLRYATYRSHEENLKKKKDEVHKSNERVEDLPAQGAAEILAAN